MIEIYRYEPQDLNMSFNKWAWPLKNKKRLVQLRKYLIKNYSFTIFDTKINEPIAVLGFNELNNKEFYGLIVASDKFGNNPKYAVKMKYLINCVIKEYGVKKTITISEDAPELNKWHEFIGFKKEMKLPKYFRGKDFIYWSMDNGN